MLHNLKLNFSVRKDQQQIAQEEFCEIVNHWFKQKPLAFVTASLLYGHCNANAYLKHIMPALCITTCCVRHQESSILCQIDTQFKDGNLVFLYEQTLVF